MYVGIFHHCYIKKGLLHLTLKAIAMYITSEMEIYVDFILLA